MPAMSAAANTIWVFGDYRNYFQNRVTLQLLAKGRELAAALGGSVGAVVVGHGLDEYVREYVAHGADQVVVVDDPRLGAYRSDLYAALVEHLVRRFGPRILLIGATLFGRELAPRIAMRLGTGLTADCVGLEINDRGELVQTAPFFGGNLLAEIVGTSGRVQMATVRPGIFSEIPHDDSRTADIVRLPLPDDLAHSRLRLIRSQRLETRDQRLEDAAVVVCGGRGMGSKTKFKKLFELARLLGGEVGATRPVVYAGWTGADTLVGQAGRQVRPRILFSFGISGAIQHTAACNGADFIIAVNKNPEAAMMKMADVAVVADANQFCAALIKLLRGRRRD